MRTIFHISFVIFHWSLGVELTIDTQRPFAKLMANEKCQMTNGKSFV